MKKKVDFSFLKEKPKKAKEKIKSFTDKTPEPIRHFFKTPFAYFRNTFVFCKKTASAMEATSSLIWVCIFALAASYVITNRDSLYTVIFLITFPYISLTCRRFKDTGLKWYLPLCVLAFIAVTLIAVTYTFTKVMSSIQDKFDSLVLSASINPEYILEKSQIATILFPIAGVLAIIAVIYFIYIMFIKESDSLTNKKITVSVFLTSACLAVVFTAAGLCSLYTSLDSVFEDVKKSAYSYTIEDAPKDDDGDDVDIITSGILISGLDKESVDDVIDYYNNEMTTTFSDTYKDYTSDNYKVADNIYLLPLFVQNVNGDESKQIPLIEIAIYNSSDDGQKVHLNKIKIGNSLITVDKDYTITTGLNFIPLRLDDLSTISADAEVYLYIEDSTAYAKILDISEYTSNTTSTSESE